MKFSLPEKKFLILILVLAFVNPLNYAAMSATTPEGRVFLGYSDDAFQLALMKSVTWDFESPWDFGITVFENPILGASYTFVAIGTIPAIIGIDMFAVFFVIKFFLSVIYLILVYNVIRHFLASKNMINAAFLIFLLSSGIGWIIYGASLLSFGSQYTPLVGYTLTNEFEELGGGANALSHLTRVYWLLPEITGLLSFLFFARRRHVISGVLLGITVLFYPTFAVGFAAIFLVYAIVENYGKEKFIRNTVKSLIPVAVISALFAIPWAVNYLQSPYYFSQYRLWFSPNPLVKLFVTFGLTMALALYGLAKKTKTVLNSRLFISALAVFGALSSFIHVYELTGGNSLLLEWFVVTGLNGPAAALFANYLLIDIPLLVLFAAIFVDVLRKDIEKNYKFLILWVIAIILITIVPSQLVFWWPARMAWFLLLPLAMASVFGIDYLSKARPEIFGRSISSMKIVAVIIIISIPSLVGFNIWMQRVAHSSGIAYVSEDDNSALAFLSAKEEGRVLSSYQIGNNIPYHTGQRSLLFNGARDERMSDYESFFSSSTPDAERQDILEKYNITYVFFGENERAVSNGEIILDDSEFLKNIYDDGTKVYLVL